VAELSGVDDGEVLLLGGGIDSGSPSHAVSSVSMATAATIDMAWLVRSTALLT